MNLSSLTWHHAWWIPLSIIYYIGYGWLSKINHDHATTGMEPWYTSRYLWIMFAYGALCPFWLIISRVSKNILFDGMLYDNILFTTYIFTMIALGAGEKFTVHQWIGVALVALGSIMMRVTL
jgi:hypothetical protein